MRLNRVLLSILSIVNHICIVVVVFTIVISILAVVSRSLPFKLKQEAHLHFKTYNSLILGNEYTHAWTLLFIILMNGKGREE